MKKSMNKDEMSWASFLVCLIALTFWIAYKCLPSSHKVNITSSSVDSKPAAKTALSANSNTSPKIEEFSPIATGFQQPAISDETISAHTALFGEDVLRNLEDPTAPLSSACGKLSKVNRQINPAMQSGSAPERLGNSIMGRSTDLTYETVQPVLRYVFRQPNLHGVIGRFGSETVGIQDALAAINQNRKEMERILDQSYLLYMLSRTVEQNPDLASDPHVLTYCNAIEDQLNHFSKSNFADEKMAFAEFLNAVKVNPEKIEFDMNYRTDLSPEVEANSYTYDVGWLKKVNVMF
jgi:hypothetical protein